MDPRPIRGSAPRPAERQNLLFAGGLRDPHDDRPPPAGRGRGRRRRRAPRPGHPARGRPGLARSGHRLRAGHGGRPRLLRGRRSGQVQPGDGPRPADRLVVQADRAGGGAAGRAPPHHRLPGPGDDQPRATAATRSGTSTTTARAARTCRSTWSRPPCARTTPSTRSSSWTSDRSRPCETAASMGIRVPLQAVPSAVLGANDVRRSTWHRPTPPSPTAACHVTPVLVTRITRADGTIVYEAVHQQSRVLTMAVADQVTGVLRQVVERGTGTARPARPAGRRQDRHRRSAGPTPGSAATRRSWRPRCGSASRSRPCRWCPRRRRSR